MKVVKISTCINIYNTFLMYVCLSVAKTREIFSNIFPTEKLNSLPYIYDDRAVCHCFIEFLTLELLLKVGFLT